MSTTAAPLPKGLYHLKFVHKNKFVKKGTPYLAPKDRIAKWNIREGDKVRLMVGKAEDKYVDGISKASGWKVHEVIGLRMKENKLLLKEVTAKKNNPLYHNRPWMYEHASPEEKEAYDKQAQFYNVSIPINYSNVQLCVHADAEDPLKSVFATRVSTDHSQFNKRTGRLDYTRYAANVVGGAADSVVLEEGKELARVDWPETKKPSVGPPSVLDTLRPAVRSRTLSLLPSSSIWSKPGSLPVKDSIRASSSTLPRFHSDNYIDSTLTPGFLPAGTPEIDSFMPLYLSEELSPRFSRAKATQGWNLRKAQEEEEREAFAASAVKSWIQSGKDQGLEEALRATSLGDVKIRKRTEKEVRESAIAEYDTLLAERSKLARVAKRAGGKYDVGRDKWMVTVGGAKDKKMAKKERREESREKKLEALKV